MALNAKQSHLRSNPIIFDKTPKEPSTIYIPKSFFIFLLTMAVIGGITYLIFFSDYFKIKNIIIKGDINREARGYLESLKGSNIFSVSKFGLADRIKEIYPEAYQVNIYKGLPDAIKVKLEKRTVVLIWQSNGKSFLVDKEGIVFQRVDNYVDDKKLPLVVDVRNFEVTQGKRLVSSKFIAFATYINENFSKTSVRLARIEIEETSFHPVVVTEPGWKILMDINRSPSDQIDDLKVIVSKHLPDIKEYIDLRVPGYGFYK